MASQSASSPVKSAMRTLDILELAAGRSGPVTAHEIAITLGIPVSSLSYLLSTLVERGYLERDRREYRLGPAIARFHPPEAEPSLAERVGPIVRALTRELNETAGFFVLRDFELEAVASEIGLHALRYSLEVGQRAPLHALAAGKAILASMSEAQLEHLFPHRPARGLYGADDPRRGQASRGDRRGSPQRRRPHPRGIFGRHFRHRPGRDRRRRDPGRVQHRHPACPAEQGCRAARGPAARPRGQPAAGLRGGRRPPVRASGEARR